MNDKTAAYKGRRHVCGGRGARAGEGQWRARVAWEGRT